MVLFHSAKSSRFQAQLHDWFAPARLSYVGLPDAEAVRSCYSDYARAFREAGAEKSLAMISDADTGIVPYLTVRSNILINGQRHDFTLLPEALRKDRLFLDTAATSLTPAQSLYVQLFRGLLAGRAFLLMADFPTEMTPQETRLFLDCAETATAQADASLIILTTDAGLLAANPDTSWQTPPQFGAERPATA